MKKMLERVLLVLAFVPSLAVVGCGSGGPAKGSAGDQGTITGPATTLNTSGTHSGGPVFLRDAAGAFITGNDQVYSPLKTCGGCHDTAKITQGYHFAQGTVAMATKSLDGFNTAKPWLLSDGMYGKW